MQPAVRDAAAAHDEDRAERAAIIEMDGGVPREWAEGYARLCTMTRPEAIPMGRWMQIINDAGTFMDRWAETARACGWQTYEVFGVHAERPASGVHAAGLVWLIKDWRIVEINARGAVLESPSGARQTYYRRKGTRGIPLWRLSTD